MGNNINQIIRQLRRLLRAYDRFSRAVGGPEISESELDKEFEELCILIRKYWSVSLDNFMQIARDKLKEGDEITEDILKKEALVLSELRVDESRLKWFYEVYQEIAKSSDKCPATSEELVYRLEELHDAAKKKITASRSLGRKNKKKRKRHVAKAIASSIIGVGAIVGNANLTPIMVWSYAFGLGALHQATRDLIGESS